MQARSATASPAAKNGAELCKPPDTIDVAAQVTKPSTTGLLKHPEDIRSIVSTCIFFALAAFTWARYRTPLSGGLTSFACWIALFQLAFMGAVTAHNAIHTPFFRSAKLNNIYQIALSLQWGWPVSVFIPGHNLSHHKYTQESRDTMRTTKLKFKWHLLNGLLYYFVITGGGNADDSNYFAAQERKGRPVVWQRKREIAIVATSAACLAILDWRKLIWVFVLPQLWAKYCILSLNMLQHDGCEPKSRYNAARNFTDPLLNYLAFNNGYHTVHHLYPGLHWSVLPQKHKELIEPYMAPSLNQPSMIAYMWRTFVWPGIRVDLWGNPLVLTEEEMAMKDEPWFYGVDESYSKEIE